MRIWLPLEPIQPVFKHQLINCSAMGLLWVPSKAIRRHCFLQLCLLWALGYTTMCYKCGGHRAITGQFSSLIDATGVLVAILRMHAAELRLQVRYTQVEQIKVGNYLEIQAPGGTLLFR